MLRVAWNRVGQCIMKDARARCWAVYGPLELEQLDFQVEPPCFKVSKIRPARLVESASSGGQPPRRVATCGIRPRESNSLVVELVVGRSRPSPSGGPYPANRDGKRYGTSLEALCCPQCSYNLPPSSPHQAWRYLSLPVTNGTALAGALPIGRRHASLHCPLAERGDLVCGHS
jgi:hypothetical protein